MRYLKIGITPLVLVALFSATLLAQNPSVRVGIVVDGRSSSLEESLEILKREVTAVLEDEHEVSFSALFGEWKLPGIGELADQLLSDPDTDILIALGPISSQYVASRRTLSKPAFASEVTDPALQQLPFEERKVDTLRPGETEEFRVSGIRNLNYLLFGGGSIADGRRLQNIIQVSRMTVLLMEATKEAIPALDSLVAQRSRELQIEASIVPVSDSVPATLARIPEDTDAVFVTPLYSLTDAQKVELIAGFNSRKLPSLSSIGRPEVEMGMLVSLYSADDPVRRARRIALNIQETLDGRDPGEMSIEFDRDDRLVINMATARLIGASLKYSTLLEAELLNEEPGQFARNLSLGAVVREATVVNLDLAAADRTVAAGKESIRERRGPLLPQVGLSGAFNLIDKDRAKFFPTLAESELSGSLTARQLIYSDQAWSNYSIEKSFQDLRMEERLELRLDVVLEAADAYLNLLRAQTIERIQKENLNLTRSNLDLASSRVEIGVAGREEAFRWESQKASNQRAVVDASAFKRQARIAVNRTLNRPLNEVFGTVEASLNDPKLVATFESLAPFIDNPRGFSLYTEFMSAEALAASPEIKQLDAAIRATNRDLASAQRSFFLPEIDLSGGITSFKGYGAGSELPPGLNNTDWFVGINATIPLFQGSARFARVNRVKLEVEGLNLQREASRQRVEQRIRSALEAANASFQGIELAQAQSRAAKENLGLVTDSYAAGVVGILALLDAQNEALVADLGAANAVFRYLNDLMQVQRGTGRFDYFRSAQERSEFLSRLNQYYQQQGVVLRRP